MAYTPPRRRGIPVPEFCWQLSIGKTTGYEIINKAEVTVFKVGKKTLVDVDSIDAYIERNRVTILPMGAGNLRGNIPKDDEQPTKPEVGDTGPGPGEGVRQRERVAAKKPSPPSSLLRRLS